MLCSLIAFYFFSLISIHKKSDKGFFDVSFNTENNPIAPPGFMQWLMSKRYRQGAGDRIGSKSGRPNSLESSGIQVKLPKSNYMTSSGNGFSPPGRELIFKAKSPVKLYWLAQLYDVYDGKGWQLSERLKKAKTKNAALFDNHSINNYVEQEFVIEKWISSTLYCAYRPISVDSFKYVNYYDTMSCTAYNVALKTKTYPKLPYYYSITSIMYLPEKNPKKATSKLTHRKSDYWPENIRVSHYLRLPRRLISNRVRTLAKYLTKDIKSPYDKAIALRNYLRKNFKYEQYSQKTPPEKESVDFFLFEIKEGHCEYFASSLTVLARLCGLPARVATGFSPGNYNALNKCFEIHAYHAHAWTQIFIDGMGWITFDATPPGNIESVTTPFAIGKLRDPFGDEWRITPPELTKSTVKFLKDSKAAQLENAKTKYNYTMVDSMLLKLSTTTDGIKNYFKRMLGEQLEALKEKGLSKFFNGWQKFKLHLSRIWSKLKSHLSLAVFFFKNNFILLIPIMAIAFALMMEYIILRTFFNRRKKLVKCRQCFADAKENIIKDPSVTIRTCYIMTRTLLNMAGYPRRKNRELLDYGNALHKLDNELRKNAVVLFYFYTKLEYGKDKISRKEAEEALERTRMISEFLYSLIKETDEIEYLK
ncbi:MAG: transglutaminase domain-containing protein [Lentisphaerae bacterium]|nr:transglutaminase domain-containing protein [Lentisphaerota bacterium]MCP4103485.1 transglutaminase domain-containing protein [Lentisphaerota bacterium]